MSWMQRGALVLAAGLGGLIVVGRVRGASSEGRTGADSPMKDAVYATAIPVYPGAKLNDVMGGNYYNDLGGPVTFTSQSWFFSLSDPVAKVAEYYRQHLPDGYRPREVEQGEIGFEWTPPGAAEGEEVHITVREGQLQIGETVKAKAGS